MKKLFLFLLLVSLSFVVKANDESALFKQLDGVWTSDVMQNVRFDTENGVWGGAILGVEHFCRKLEFVNENVNDNSVQIKSNGKPLTIRFLPKDGEILITMKDKMPVVLKRVVKSEE